MLRAAGDSRFYGKIVLVFQDGKLQHVENQRTIRPPNFE
jgi:hypothetical protein